VFDLRYHVASLAAVFIALVLGIVVGVGLSESGVAKQAELKNAQNDLEDARAELERRTGQLREYEGTRNAFRNAYPYLMDQRLNGKRIAVLVVGQTDADISDAIARTLADADATSSGTPTRLIALKVPIEEAELDATLADAGPEFAHYVGSDQLGSLGRALAAEFVRGGEMPLWELLAGKLVEQRGGAFTQPVDGLVVVRTTEPQKRGTARLLSGLVSGLASQGVPAVGVEESDAEQSAVETFRNRGLSTVDDVDLSTGRVALALLLAGAAPGQYGIKETAADGVLPPVEPLVPQP
jgi:Copper transport outer membrane protein, MctB